MNAIVLPRIELPVFEMERMGAVLKQSADKFDYTHGILAVQDFRLLKVLAKLEILPFELQAVRDYKSQMRRTNLTRMPWNWHRWYQTSLRYYNAPVPIEVLQKANAVRDELCVTVGVEYFSKRAQEYRCDPFLWVQVSESTPRHYIAVWDEPKFVN
jgi:hypothetical protein